MVKIPYVYSRVNYSTQWQSCHFNALLVSLKCINWDLVNKMWYCALFNNYVTLNEIGKKIDIIFFK